MKPSTTQIFPSASPATLLFFFLLGSCLFIGFLCWALIPMHSFVDFQVDWPMLLFRSRPQIPCRDITLSLCRFQLFIPDVATSISCHDITLCLCRFQLFVPDVATSAHVFAAFNWCLLVLRHQSLFATSAHVFADFNWSFFWCRDINLLSRHQLMSLQLSTGHFLVSRHQSSVATSAHVFASFN